MGSEGAENVLDRKILTYKNKAPLPPQGYNNQMAVLYSSSAHSKAVRNIVRENRQVKVEMHASGKSSSSRRFALPANPERMLDAPNLLDDFYVNTLDWSSKNIVAVGLSSEVYLWNAVNGDTRPLMQVSGDESYISALSFSSNGTHLAVGTGGNTCSRDAQIWDVSAHKQVRSLSGAVSCINTLAWNRNILTVGTKGGAIIHHDVRIRNSVVLSVRHAHSGQICGLKWSPDGTQLASGGNDNIVNIWEAGREDRGAFLSLTDHQAAIKAMDWCPWQQNVLATGGGTSDRTIKVWNTRTGALLKSVDTKSQVSSVKWSKNTRHLISSHGFRENSIRVWDGTDLTSVGSLTKHQGRILHMAMSPDGERIVSASADNSLHFWHLFPSTDKVKVSKPTSSSQNYTQRLR